MKTTITILTLLLASATLQDCSQGCVDCTQSTICTQCYKTTLTTKGVCVASQNPRCIFSGFYKGTKKVTCQWCAKNYGLNYGSNFSCEPTANPPNCVSAIKQGQTTLCLVCENGKQPNASYSRCITPTKTTPNCLWYTSFGSGSPICVRCKLGFSNVDLQGGCIPSPSPGCWAVSQADKTKCVTCNPFEGYFAIKADRTCTKASGVDSESAGVSMLGKISKTYLKVLEGVMKN